MGGSAVKERAKRSGRWQQVPEVHAVAHQPGCYHDAARQDSGDGRPVARERDDQDGAARRDQDGEARAGPPEVEDQDREQDQHQPRGNQDLAATPRSGPPRGAGAASRMRSCRAWTPRGASAEGRSRGRAVQVGPRHGAEARRRQAEEDGPEAQRARPAGRRHHGDDEVVLRLDAQAPGVKQGIELGDRRPVPRLPYQQEVVGE